MKKVLPLIALMIFFSMPLAAQHLDAVALDELARTCPPDAQLKAAQNVLAQVDGNKITQDWEKTTGVDPYFSLRLKEQKITNQKGTGRCWMFSALNIIRPVIAEKLGCKEIELSQNYLYFWEKLEKANLFLNGVIETREKSHTDRVVESLLKTNIQDGQNWLGFIGLVKKYGVVPIGVMPETYSSSNSGHVNRVLSTRLKQAAVRIRSEKNPARVAALRQQALKDVYKILAINFGIPPKSFTWRFENPDKKLVQLEPQTPQQFFNENVGDRLESYYALYSIPTLEFNKKYAIERNRIVSSGEDLYFVNVPLAAMKEMAKNSLLDSSAVWFGCDVGQQANSEIGLLTAGLYDYQSLYGIDFAMTRRELFESYSSVPNHNMVFTGVDIIDGRITKWLVENSWGEARGKQGYLHMTDDWFDLYVQEIVIDKKYIPAEMLKIFDSKATLLPPWDPMAERVGL
ncbi:MAG TPA: C1 family peptidase [bacterium]|nr:C1 family peptidase [bacterium]